MRLKNERDRMGNTMKSIAIVIPNYNGMRYLPGCLDSLREQTDRDFEIIMIDNGSTDESVPYVRAHYPEVRIRAYHRNTGFCAAVNAGIRMSSTPYVLLLNNDIVCNREMVGELHRAIQSSDTLFSCCAKMISMQDPSVIDDAGDLYCALGWAFARGKGASRSLYCREENVFSCCAAAAIYRREILDRIGLFDEKHFAYLEDLDIGYRARIQGYKNRYIPSAIVYHAGSATSGSRHNAFKVRLSARNSLWILRKNMPAWQILLNAPLLAAGYMVKAAYFTKKHLGKAYLQGLAEGLRGMGQVQQAPGGRLGTYLKIQLELWKNCFLRIFEGVRERSENSA